MSRPLRIEYPGAVYHVLCRGNNRQKIFRDDLDRRGYLEKLVHYCELKEVSLLGYCLLSNHIHLLVETPQGNPSKDDAGCANERRVVFQSASWPQRACFRAAV